MKFAATASNGSIYRRVRPFLPLYSTPFSPPSINCLGRRVTSYTTRDRKEIAKLSAMVP